MDNQQWQIGDAVEIYSRSMNRWYEGEIATRIKDPTTDWFRIKFFTESTFAYKDVRVDDKGTLRHLQVVRQSWGIGTPVRIYSKSSKMWFRGQIKNVIHDDEGEWLEIQYGKGLTKQIKRYNWMHLRPVDPQTLEAAPTAATKPAPTPAQPRPQPSGAKAAPAARRQPHKEQEFHEQKFQVPVDDTPTMTKQDSLRRPHTWQDVLKDWDLGGHICQEFAEMYGEDFKEIWPFLSRRELIKVGFSKDQAAQFRKKCKDDIRMPYGDLGSVYPWLKD